MVKVKTLMLMIVFLLMSSFGNVSAASVYQGDEELYSFDVPNGWIEIPDGSIKTVIKGSENAFTSDKNYIEYITYKAAFQKENEGYFKFPFMVVSHKKTTLPANLVNLELVKETYTRLDVASEHKRVGTEFKNFEIEYKNVNEEKSVIMVVSNAEVGSQKLKVLTSMYFTEEMIVQVDFYMLENQYLKYQVDVQKVMASFAFKEAGEPVDVVKGVKEEPIKEVVEVEEGVRRA